MSFTECERLRHRGQALSAAGCGLALLPMSALYVGAAVC